MRLPDITAIAVLRELNDKWQQRYSLLAQLRFSDWVSWDRRNTISGIDRVGVYVLAKCGATEMTRQADQLDEKVIYVGKTNIGSTTNLRNRLSAFDRTAFRDGSGHAGGHSYRQKFGTVQDGLRVSVCPIYWSGDSKGLDGRDLDIYWQVQTLQVVTQMETCLRGVHVLKWGRLPVLNKE